MKRTPMLMAALLLLASPVWAARMQPLATDAGEDLEVDIWLNQEEGAVYHRGETLQINARTNYDAYLAVYNVDVDGFITLLYPRYEDPYWVPAGQIVGVPGPRDDYELVVDNRKGIEYVVAVASPYPLQLEVLDPLGANGYRVVDTRGRITGDPSQAIWELNESLAWADPESGPEGYASDVTWFYVREHVPYPRFLVYDWYPEQYWDPFWDPYVSVSLWVDYHWDHHWCGSHWWWRGHRPRLSYWYRRHQSGPREHWKSVVVHDYPTNHRSKPPRVTERSERGARYLDRPEDSATKPVSRPGRNDGVRYRPESRPNRSDRPSTSRRGAIKSPPRRADKPATAPRARPADKPRSRPKARPAPKPAAKPKSESKPKSKPQPEKKSEKKPDKPRERGERGRR